MRLLGLPRGVYVPVMQRGDQGGDKLLHKQLLPALRRRIRVYHRGKVTRAGTP